MSEERMTGADRGQMEEPTSKLKELTVAQEMDFFTRLQKEVGEWSQKNFGDQGAYRPALGVIEEICELAEGISLLAREEILDAIGDITIYMADYFHRRGWRIAEVWFSNAMPIAGAPAGPYIHLIRWLSHSHLKGEQKIRGGAVRHDGAMRDTLGQTLWFIHKLCRQHGVDYFNVVKRTWARVSKRDWVENPDTAHALVPVVDFDPVRSPQIEAVRARLGVTSHNVLWTPEDNKRLLAVEDDAEFASLVEMLDGVHIGGGLREALNVSLIRREEDVRIVRALEGDAAAHALVPSVDPGQSHLEELRLQQEVNQRRKAAENQAWPEEVRRASLAEIDAGILGTPADQEVLDIAARSAKAVPALLPKPVKDSDGDSDRT